MAAPMRDPRHLAIDATTPVHALIDATANAIGKATDAIERLQRRIKHPANASRRGDLQRELYAAAGRLERAKRMQGTLARAYDDLISIAQDGI